MSCASKFTLHNLRTNDLYSPTHTLSFESFPPSLGPIPLFHSFPPLLFPTPHKRTQTQCTQKTFLADEQGMIAAAKEEMMAHEHYDSSREPHEFKGFFLEEV